MDEVLGGPIYDVACLAAALGFVALGAAGGLSILIPLFRGLWGRR